MSSLSNCRYHEGVNKTVPFPTSKTSTALWIKDGNCRMCRRIYLTTRRQHFAVVLFLVSVPKKFNFFQLMYILLGKIRNLIAANEYYQLFSYLTKYLTQFNRFLNNKNKENKASALFCFPYLGEEGVVTQQNFSKHQKIHFFL